MLRFRSLATMLPLVAGQAAGEPPRLVVGGELDIYQ